MGLVVRGDKSSGSEEAEHSDSPGDFLEYPQQKDEESESESESDTDDEEENEKPPSDRRSRDRLDEMVNELKRNGPEKVIILGVDLSRDSGVKEFIDKNHEYIIRSPGRSNQNLLHLIAEGHGLPHVKKMKKLLLALVQLDANLLKGQDENGKTPIHSAILNRNRKLVKLMCDSHNNINSILRLQTLQRANCLHLAFKGKRSSHDDSLLALLIDKSEEDTLSATDEDGLTPLHIAVAHDLCDDGQLLIIRQLLDKCDKAASLKGGPDLLSPYQHHVCTCQKAERAEGRRLESLMAMPPPQRIDEVGPRRKPSMKPFGREDRKNSLPVDRTQDSLEGARNRVNHKPVQASVAAESPGKNGAIRKYDRGMGSMTLGTSSSNVVHATPSDSGRNRPTPSRTGKAKLQPTKKSVSAVGQCLKEYYLRTRDYDDAVNVLYGAQHDKQINFDLTSLEMDFSTLSEGQIKQGLQHQEFENVLQYVAIPQLRVEKDADLPRSEPGQRPTKPSSSIGSGRTDLQIIFNWLKDEKKVKKVFRVIVDDLEEPSHQDEAVESCLKDIQGVETWDWKKFDLSPDIILNAARHAKVVNLYWSGRNIALRAWSEERGLHQLEHLEKVYLHYQQGLESQDRMKEYIGEFKRTMEAYTRKDGAGNDTRITVIPYQLKTNERNGPNNKTSMFKDRYEPEKWIKTMERRQKGMERTESTYTAREPIKVAVIDDGVNTFDPRIHVGGGRSFCRRDKSQNLVHSYYVSSQGHGTAMAVCISQICPSVELYILRLDEYSSEPGNSFFTAESAEKAVRAAIEQKVDIISMSWTIEETEDNKHHVAALDKAISEAAGKSILMFCAATDGGAQTDVSYPAMASTKHIFKIGGAEPSGNPDKWLGETNERHGGGGGEPSSTVMYRPRTGSSVATARASGLAAVILHCAKGSAMRARATTATTSITTAASTTVYDELRNHDRMNEVFLRIGTTLGKYILVWDKFDQPVKDAESNNTPRDEWTAYLDDLVRRLTWRG
ncbi:uncharacterized protein PG998_010440 [Apiospora kogelbergensis]|uniref:uncharacterized protein n=1 Tax=Apiospora kogelbergensis TaxID=1337665 RepID=UPI00312E473A